MKALLASVVLLLGGAGAARAEVVSAGPSGFEVRAQRVVAATPERTWAALGRIGDWWDKAHSYSNDGANMSLTLERGGCFCETIPGKAGTGFVEHGRVLLARPTTSIVIEAALGPILYEGAIGRLTWTLKPVGGGTEVTQSYVVGGHLRGGGEKLPPLVDGVLGQALERLQAHLAR